MQWFAQAPSNIALIKYMGKKDPKTNIPLNPSLSYTLNQLLSSVMLEEHSGKKDLWEPLITPGGDKLALSEKEQERFLNHLIRLKAHFQYSGAFIVRSTNNFPHSSGLASSASSFAALTKCACLALSELQRIPLPSVTEQAQMSRLGSGSSCRSFFSPWAIWDQEDVKEIQLPFQELIHQVIIISHDEKKVPSSEAHSRINTSPHYPLRAEQAKDHLKTLLAAFEARDWKMAYEVCWREFQDLHMMFATSCEPFSYMTDQTKTVLALLQDEWVKNGDGPIVTMDAGPNIHLLYRLDQAELARIFKQDHMIGNYDVL